MRAVNASVHDFQRLYAAVEEVPEREGRVSRCKKATDYLQKIVYFPWTVKNVVSSKLASATVQAAQKTFRLMPRFVQRKYDNYCLVKAEKVADKLMELGPIPNLVNQVACSSLGSFFSRAFNDVQQNSYFRAALFFGELIAPNLVSTVMNPKDAALKQTVVPIVKMAHEFLAEEGLKLAYRFGIDTTICVALNQPQLIASLEEAQLNGLTTVRLLQTALLTYVYGPTVYKTGVLAVNLYGTHAKFTKLKNILFSKEQQSFADKLAAQSGIPEISGDQILRASLFLLFH